MSTSDDDLTLLGLVGEDGAALDIDPALASAVRSAISCEACWTWARSAST